MTSKNFLKNANHVLDLMVQNLDFRSFLKQNKKHEEFLSTAYYELIGSYNGGPSQAQPEMVKVINVIKKKCNDIISEINKFQVYTLFKEANELQLGLNKIEYLTDDDKLILESRTKDFFQHYTKTISEKNLNDIYSFSVFCRRYDDLIEKYYNIAKIADQNLQQKALKMPKGRRSIDIQIVSKESNLKDFAGFIFTIDELYEGVCKSVNIAYEDYPLNIIKIESGSIWANLLGHKEIVKLINDMFLWFANYLRDYHTKKISLERFENEIKKVDLLMELVKKSKGLNLEENKHLQLEKVLGKAIINLNKHLPKSTTEINLDNQPLLKLEPSEIKAIEGRRTLLLESENNKNKTSEKNKSS